MLVDSSRYLVYWFLFVCFVFFFFHFNVVMNFGGEIE